MNRTLRREIDQSLPLAHQPGHVTAATVLCYTPVVGQYIVTLYYTVVESVQDSSKKCGCHMWPCIVKLYIHTLL